MIFVENIWYRYVFIRNNQFINLSTLSNLIIYYIKKLWWMFIFSKLIGTHYWISYLSLSETQNTSSLYFIIYIFLGENKLKLFSWTLFQIISPNKVLLFKFKIYRNSVCNFCKNRWRLLSLLYYLYLFKWILEKMSKFNEGIGCFNTKITLKHTVFGYKTDD